MDIGTAKPTPAERAEVPHHLIDLADPCEDFTVARFRRRPGDALADIEARGHRALLVGGTGLYLRAVVDELDDPRAVAGRAGRAGGRARHRRPPPAPGRAGPAGRGPDGAHQPPPGGAGPGGDARQRAPVLVLRPRARRLPADPFRLVGVAAAPRGRGRAGSRPATASRWRTASSTRSGRLLAAPGGLSRTARQALGYAELLAHLEAGRPLDEAVDLAVRRTRRFARRQRAWFRRDPRIRWLQALDDPLTLLPGCGRAGELGDDGPWRT